MADPKAGSPKFSVKVEGLAELREAMKALPKELAAGPMRSALNKAAEVVQEQAIANAPEDSGTLKRAIFRAKHKQTSGPFVESWIVGVRMGRKFGAKTKKDGSRILSRDAWYWKFLEFGTSKMKPWRGSGFLRPAFEQTKHFAMNVIITELADGLRRAARRYQRKLRRESAKP